MTEGTSDNAPRELTKEERLAAKLRENLRKRKAQGREMRESTAADLSKPEGES